MSVYDRAVCPHCGKSQSQVKRVGVGTGNSFHNEWAVVCSNYGARGPNAMTAVNAVEFWNLRRPPEPEPVGDMYVKLVAKALDIVPEAVTPELRQAVKVLLFSMICGGQPFSEDAAVEYLRLCFGLRIEPGHIEHATD